MFTMIQQQEQKHKNEPQLHRESQAEFSELQNDLIAAEAESEKYRQRVIHLYSIAKSQAIEIGTERRKRKRAEKKLRRSRFRLKKSDQDRREWMRKAKSINSELNSLRRRIKRSETASQGTVQSVNNNHKGQVLHAPSEAENRTEIESDLKRTKEELEKTKDELKRLKQAQSEVQSINKGSPNKQVIEAHYKRREAENDLKRTKDELEKTEDELKRLKQAQHDLHSNNKDRPNKQVIEERDKRRRAQKEYKKTKQKLRHASRELNFLRREHNKNSKKSSLSSGNGLANSHQLVKALLPNLILVHDSAEHLRISNYTRQIFERLQKLNNDPKSVRADRIGSAEPWLEMRPAPTPTERIYYQKIDSRYLVLLGDKNSQDKDINWMKINQRGGL